MFSEIADRMELTNLSAYLLRGEGWQTSPDSCENRVRAVEHQIAILLDTDVTVFDERENLADEVNNLFASLQDTYFELGLRAGLSLADRCAARSCLI